jgi:hypothetical protein
MDLRRYLLKDVRVELLNGQVFTGNATDVTDADEDYDNEESITVIPVSGELKGRFVAILESEIKSITETNQF